jgi:hypothetical protein
VARVMLDTGRYVTEGLSFELCGDRFVSSDLWVAFPDNQPSSNDLGKGVTLSYAVGKASGH